MTATRGKSSDGTNETLKSPLGALFVHQLKDVYFAENAITKALPKMVKAAKSEQLKGGFQKHLKQTQEHVSRLEKVFGMLGLKPEGTECEAIKGILKEGDEVAAEFGQTSAGDAGLVASAQAVEHYEITRYGTLKAWAQQLGFDDVAGVFETTEQEEIDTDEILTELAGTVNETALQAAA
jgi:ferritin-like metal-binding protein YciE